MLDFYQTVHKVSQAIEKYYKADALNITIQDGASAGQSVPHLHCHIIPRRLNDLPNVDDIYKLLDGKEGDLEYVFQTIKQNRSHESLGVDSDQRPPRSVEDMADEATRLEEYMKGGTK
jgi:bis(5'-adenosyl)-triphosphatase